MQSLPKPHWLQDGLRSSEVGIVGMAQNKNVPEQEKIKKIMQTIPQMGHQTGKIPQVRLTGGKRKSGGRALETELKGQFSHTQMPAKDI